MLLLLYKVAHDMTEKQKKKNIYLNFPYVGSLPQDAQLPWKDRVPSSTGIE